MKNENFEKYIREFSPELQEKAKKCQTKEELLALAAENDVELSEETLDMISGGDGCLFHTCHFIVKEKFFSGSVEGYPHGLFWIKEACEYCEDIKYYFQVEGSSARQEITEDEYNRAYCPLNGKNYR